MMYVNQKYLSSIDWILLEIKLPRDIFKSPLATEMAIVGFLQSSGASTKYARNFEGRLPHFGSLEIASIEGVIHFYIRVAKRYRTLFESNFYAQYPGIEIIEADDYTKRIRYHHLITNEIHAWGMNYRLAKAWKPIDPKTGKEYPDPKPDEPDKKYSMKADFFPLKTYVDYGLDKDPKEEYKVDPLTPLLEMMGNLGKGEHMWYQVLIQDESVYNGSKMPKFYINEKTHRHMSLGEMAKQYIKQLRTSHYVKHGDVAFDEYGYEKTRRVPDGEDAEGKPKTKEIFTTYNLITKDNSQPDAKALPKKEMDLTQSEKEEIEVINKKLSKPLVAVVVRIMYIAKKENFQSGQIATTINYMRWFEGANKFVPNNITDPYDYPWEKYGGKRVHWRTEELFEAYVEREGFYPHIPKREALDKWEDLAFYTSSMKQRKLFRLIFETIFYPFDHPTPDEVMMLNLEEVATLWHLPGATAGTPTLPRIDSNKGVAPTNLPV